FSYIFKQKEKQPVQKTPKTRADLEDTLFVRYESGDNKLKSIFVKTRAPEAKEKRELQEIFDMIEAVPEGKKLITDVATAGYKINFDTFRGASAGTCNPGEKRIMLCPANHANKAAIAASLYHEMTHAMQNERSGDLLKDCSSYNIADQVKLLRAAEASAWMEEAKFAYQIKETHPEILKHVEHVPMYQAFAAEMEKTKDIGKAGEAAFKSWYGYKEYQTGYEDQHISIIKNRTLDRLHNNNSKAFRKSMSSEDVLKQMIISENIAIKPEFLTTPEAFSISDDAVKSFKAISKGYAAKFWTAVKDTSVDNMYSYETGKLVSSAETVLKKEEKNNASVMSALTTISKTQADKKAVLMATKKHTR
ncbi:MAG: DUF6782 family putative metallopeptidase, partial [Alphaproteobacteria bacterium]